MSEVLICQTDKIEVKFYPLLNTSVDITTGFFRQQRLQSVNLCLTRTNYLGVEHLFELASATFPKLRNRLNF